ncbi:MAG: response regulator [Planctomycetes bacterium]|nr:response regulator [Planctomycetota bacterium]
MDKILIVDDERVCLTVASKILEHEGYDCISCQDADEAIHLAEVEKFALVLTDYDLGNNTGTNLFCNIKKAHPFTRGILMSSYLNFSNMTETIEANFDDCIPKPIDAAMLCQSILRSVSIIVHWRLRFHLMRKGEASSVLRNAVGRSFSHLPNAMSLHKFEVSQDEVDDIITKNWNPKHKEHSS